MSKRLSEWLWMPPRMWVESFEVDPLFQDFNNGVVTRHSNRDRYTLSGARLPKLLSLDPYSHQAGSRIDEFIRETAARLLIDHQVWLEVVLDDEADKEAPFSVVPVLGVKRSPDSNLVQEIPDREIRLDNDTMVDIGLPTSYPSSMLLRIVKDLAELGSSMPPEWYTSQLFGQSPDPTPFDITEFSRTHRLSVLQATQQIGWTAGEVLRGQNGVISEYLRYLRELRFLHFKAAMRSQVEEGLKKAFELAKQRTGYEGKIVVEGLYTPNDVELLIGQFERGEIAFSTVSYVVFEKSEELAAGTRSIL